MTGELRPNRPPAASRRFEDPPFAKAGAEEECGGEGPASGSRSGLGGEKTRWRLLPGLGWTKGLRDWVRLSAGGSGVAGGRLGKKS